MLSIPPPYQETSALIFSAESLLDHGHSSPHCFLPFLICRFHPSTKPPILLITTPIPADSRSLFSYQYTSHSLSDRLNSFSTKSVGYPILPHWFDFSRFEPFVDANVRPHQSSHNVCAYNPVSPPAMFPGYGLIGLFCQFFRATPASGTDYNMPPQSSGNFYAPRIFRKYFRATASLFFWSSHDTTSHVWFEMLPGHDLIVLLISS